MIITPDGNVGINIATPSEKLEVNGNIAVSGRIIGTPQFYQYSIKPEGSDVDIKTYLPANPIMGDRVIFSNIGSDKYKLINIPVIGDILPGECCEIMWDSLTESWLGTSLPSSNIWPVGITYTQYPGKKSPIELKLPGTWENISQSYAGDFFRAEGGNASAFNEGRQEDAFKAHNHGGGDHTHSYAGAARDDFDGRAGAEGFLRYFTTKSTGASGTIINTQGDIETRPVNQTIRIWERIE